MANKAELIKSVTVNIAEVTGDKVRFYVSEGYKIKEIKTRNYWNKPPLVVLSKIT